MSSIKVNVTFDQILEFAAKFCSVTYNDLYIEANDTVLGSIVNGVSARLWKDVVEEYTDTEVSRVILSPVEILKHRFALLTNSSMQPVAMALVVLHAGFVLALDTEEENLKTTDPYVFCELSSHGLYPLWILNHIMSFDLLTEHNNVVMRVFNTLADTIGTEINETFPSKLPFPATHLLKKIRLVLPHQLYPLDTIIPKLDGNFFKNVLKIREHRLTYWTYKAPSGVPQRLVKYLRPDYGVQSGCFLILSLPVYSAVPLRHTMTVLPMAVLGFAIADSLWTVLLDTNWTGVQSTTVNNSLCSDQGGIDRTAPVKLLLKYPLRAIRSTVRAFRTADWHKKDKYFGQWRTSLSQIFYRLLLVFNFCPDQENAHLAEEEVAEIQSEISDFSESFEC
ncbi:hypothetical protein MTO96_039831 [Rhipicephalus appendiculatus]